MSDFPRVSLGQSEFQDTFMVVGEELTPFRRLRKIELQIRGLENTLRTNEFAMRKAAIKLKRLDTSDELEAVEAEEIDWELQSTRRLTDDANRRLANFREMRKQLVENTPAEYWEQGYENAEAEYWVNYYIKQAALEVISQGAIQRSTMEQITILPSDMAKTIMGQVPHQVNALSQIALEADKTHAKLLEEQQKLGREAEASQ